MLSEFGLKLYVRLFVKTGKQCALIGCMIVKVAVLMRI